MWAMNVCYLHNLSSRLLLIIIETANLTVFDVGLLFVAHSKSYSVYWYSLRDQSVWLLIFKQKSADNNNRKTFQNRFQFVN